MHFGRAGDRLHVSQPKVSQAVRRLERQLGGTLFERSTRSVTLTPFGAEFRKHAAVAYSAVVDAYEAGRHLAAQTPDVFVLAYARDAAGPLLELVRRVAPAVVELRNMPTPAQERALRQRRIHAGLGWESPDDETFSSEVIWRSSFVVIVPDGHEWAGRRTVSCREMATTPLVGWPRALAPGLTTAFASTVRPSAGQPFAETGTSLDDIAAHVLAGRGVGVMPRSLVEGRVVAGVRFVLLGDGPVVDECLRWRTDEGHPLLATVRAALSALAAVAGGVPEAGPRDCDPL